MKLMIRLIFVIITIFFIDITTYAYTAYKIGDIVPYNGMEFYAIKDSSKDDDSVTMLKAEPLTYEEIQTYSEGTGARIYNLNMQYSKDNNNYLTSYIKATVDAWANDKVQAGLVEARLLSFQDLSNYLGYSWRNTGQSILHQTEKPLHGFIM